MLKFYDQQRMRELITDLRRHLPAEVGRGNDLYGRALMAQVLLFPMPVRAARLLWRFGDLANKLLPFRNREEEDG